MQTDPAVRASRGRPRERGVATLAVTMLLLFALVIGVAFVNRNLVFEQRASANQYRSTQAFEAAEAGLEWALARLNDTRRIGADCLPSADVAATSFRDHHLRYDAANATYAAATWLDAGVATALQAACVRTLAGWSCSCPTGGRPALVAPVGNAAAPAFSVQFQGSARPGLLRIVATGCTRLGGACAAPGADAVDATAQVQVLVGLLPALRTAPAAALTARGAVDADGAAFGAHNRDAASGGLAIQAGGAVGAAAAHLTVPPGASISSAIVRDDAVLASLTPARFFATWFGIDRTGWAKQPVVHRLSCSGDCTGALLAAIDSDGGPALIHVDGDIALRGPVTLGSAQRPVVVVADGAMRIDGAVTTYGVLYAGSVTWVDPAGPAALVRGALISEADYRGDGTPEIVYDTGVLGRLKGNAGTFARVNGSWKDF